MKILILEDDARRRNVMADSLQDRFPQFEPLFATTAHGMIDLIDKHLGDTILIALDHDLELVVLSDGRLQDSGTGREVADHLSNRAPVCPVVIHSTNSPAALGMQAVLDEAGWTTDRISPFADLEWIPTLWFRTVRNAIVDSVGKTASPISP